MQTIYAHTSRKVHGNEILRDDPNDACKRRGKQITLWENTVSELQQVLVLTARTLTRTFISSTQYFFYALRNLLKARNAHYRVP